MVSRFLGFIQIGVGVGIAIAIDYLTTGHLLWFHGFIQIGVGIGIAIGIDYLTTNTRDGTARVFYPQIYTDYADFLGHRSVFLERQGEFLIFMKFHVFQGFIQIGIGVAIAIGIDCLTTASQSHSL
jgi:hypothetical protein